VLSACNTVAGKGAGAEAVSGLGLAFFYAGSRALLVSNRPVEPVSARLLTTTTFKREAANPGITRAEALRQAMLSLIDGRDRSGDTAGKLFLRASEFLGTIFVRRRRRRRMKINAPSRAGRNSV
jgi:CHAT domain-containing protein